MCSESVVCHLLTSWIHKYLESSLLSPLGPGSKIGPKCSEIGCCQPRLRSMNPYLPPRWDLSSFYLSPLPSVPCALSSTWCISVNAGAFEMCRSHWRMCAYIILPTWLARKSRFSLFQNSIMTRLFVTFEKKEKIQESKGTREFYDMLQIFWVTVSLTQMHPLHMKGTLLLFINLLDGGLWRGSGSPGDFLRKCLTSPRWLTSDFKLRKN